MKLSTWIKIEHCATRVIEGTDPAQAKNRFALIEKTPRVRLKYYQFGLEGKGCVCIGQHSDAWLIGKKGSGQLYGDDPQSREWCDKMLVLLGYELT